MRPSALILISLAPIYAAMVDITAGASPVTIANIGNAKFRFSQANFDQSLGYGSGTPNGSTFVSRDLGNNTVLGQRTYNLTLAYDPQPGFTFTMSPVGAVGPGTSLQWTASAPINGHTPTGPFNAIEIDARANLASGTLNYSNIRFTGNVQQTGAFASGTIANGIAPVQWLVSDSDLSQFAWTLEATVSGQRAAITSGDENVRFAMTVKNVPVVAAASAQTVPEPTTWLMLTMGMLLMGLSVLRKRKADGSKRCE